MPTETTDSERAAAERAYRSAREDWRQAQGVEKARTWCAMIRAFLAVTDEQHERLMVEDRRDTGVRERATTRARIRADDLRWRRADRRRGA